MTTVSSDLEKLKALPIDAKFTTRAGKLLADSIKAGFILCIPGALGDILRESAVAEAEKAKQQEYFRSRQRRV